MRESFDLGRVKRDKVGGEILARLNGQPEAYRRDDELKRKPDGDAKFIVRRLLKWSRAHGYSWERLKT